MRIRVVLADDHELLIEGFKTMLLENPEIEFVGIAQDSGALMTMVRKTKPHIVVTEVKMQKIDGITVTRRIKATAPKTEVIAMSMLNQEPLIISMLAAGAKGYILKNAPKREIIEAIKRVYNHEMFFSSLIPEVLATSFAEIEYDPLGKIPNIALTPKEKDIIKLICDQYCTKEIATRLGYKRRTVDTYREDLLKKVGAKNVVGLALFAVKAGLYDL